MRRSVSNKAAHPRQPCSAIPEQRARTSRGNLSPGRQLCAAIQRIADSERQITRAVRFLQERQISSLYRVEHFGVRAVAGDEQDGHIRPFTVDVIVHFEPAEPWQHDVEQNERDFIAVSLEFPHGFFAIARDSHAIPQSLESGAGNFAQAIVVLHNEDCFLSTADRGVWCNLRLRHFFISGGGEKHVKLSSLSKLAVYMNPPCCFTIP